MPAKRPDTFAGKPDSYGSGAWEIAFAGKPAPTVVVPGDRFRRQAGAYGAVGEARLSRTRSRKVATIRRELCSRRHTRVSVMRR